MKVGDWRAWFAVSIHYVGTRRFSSSTSAHHDDLRACIALVGTGLLGHQKPLAVYVIGHRESNTSFSILPAFRDVRWDSAASVEPASALVAVEGAECRHQAKPRRSRGPIRRRPRCDTYTSHG